MSFGPISLSVPRFPALLDFPSDLIRPVGHPALLDFPSDLIRPVGHKPEAVARVTAKLLGARPPQ
jgi:hypothetical protein